VPFVKSEFEVGKEDAENLACGLPFRDRRARELPPKDFGALANALTN